MGDNASLMRSLAELQDRLEDEQFQRLQQTPITSFFKKKEKGGVAFLMNVFREEVDGNRGERRPIKIVSVSPWRQTSFF